MEGWSKAIKLDRQTSKSELSLTLQALSFELHAGNLTTTNSNVSYLSTLGYRPCCQILYFLDSYLYLLIDY